MGNTSPLRNHYYEFDPDETAEKTFLGGMGQGTRIRLFLLFGFVMLVGMIGAFVYADRQENSAINELNRVQQVAGLVARIEASALSVNTDEQDYLRTRDPRHADSYNNSMAALLSAINAIQDMPLADDLRNDLSTISDGAVQRAQQFEKVVQIQNILGGQGDSGLTQLVRVSANALSTKLENVNEGEVAARLSAVRQLQERLKSSPDKDQLSRIESELAALKGRIGALRISTRDKSAIGALIDAYKADATQFGRTSLALSGEIGRLDEINRYMAPPLASIASFTQNLLATSVANEQRTRNIVRLWIAGGGVAALLIAILIGALIMRSMSAPLARLADATTNIVHGDLAVPIPARGNYDAVGEMANAVAYFREAIVEKETLRNQLNEEQGDVHRPDRREESGDEDEEIYLAGYDEDSFEDEDVYDDRDAYDDHDAYEEQENYEDEEDAERETPDADNQVSRPEEVSVEIAASEEEADEFDDTEDDGIPLPVSPEPPATIVKPAAPAQHVPPSIAAPRASGPTKLEDSISALSRRVTETSESASTAAFEAERTDVIIRGLAEAAEKIGEIEALIASIDDQAKFLAAAPNLRASGGENLVVLAPSLLGEDANREPNISSEERIQRIQSMSRKALGLMRDVNRIISEVKDVATEFAAATSNQALAAATELLHQSENLRGMLDGLLGRLDPEKDKGTDAETAGATGVRRGETDQAAGSA